MSNSYGYDVPAPNIASAGNYASQLQNMFAGIGRGIAGAVNPQQAQMQRQMQQQRQQQLLQQQQAAQNRFLQGGGAGTPNYAGAVGLAPDGS